MVVGIACVGLTLVWYCVEIRDGLGTTRNFFGKIMHPKTSLKYSMHQHCITYISALTQCLWSATHYAPAALWYFFLAGSIGCSSNLLAAGL